MCNVKDEAIAIMAVDLTHSGSQLGLPFYTVNEEILQKNKLIIIVKYCNFNKHYSIYDSNVEDLKQDFTT